jgi:hypothetical protein
MKLNEYLKPHKVRNSLPGEITNKHPICIFVLIGKDIFLVLKGISPRTISKPLP